MALPFDVWIDKDLGVMHTRNSCPGLRIPRKYNQAERVIVRTVEQARELDQRFRACDGCQKDMARKRDPAKDRKFHYRRNPEAMA